MADDMTTISFDDEGLKLDNAADAQVICDKLQENTDYEILILQGNTFGIEAAERVGRELEHGSKLREAHFRDLFTSRGREEVPVALSHLLEGIMRSGARLTHLDLSDNAIGPIGAPPVLKFLRSESAEQLERLLVNNCGWGPEGSTSLATVLPGLKNLKHFICGRSRLEDKGSKAISDALSCLSSIQILRLNQNGIKSTGIKDICRVIKSNRDTLKELDLSDNTIKEEEADDLGRVLSQVSNLKKLSLNDDLLNNASFRLICEALSNAPYLSTMDEAYFEGNELKGQKTVDLIMSIFKVCNRSFTLNLLENEFSKTELLRLSSFTSVINILVDDTDSDDDDSNAHVEEIDQDNSDDGFLDAQLEKDYFLEAIRDFINESEKAQVDEQAVNNSFKVLLNARLDDSTAIQLYGEELGLIKLEGKIKNPLARGSLIYMAKHLNELPENVTNFIKITVSENDELGCGKLLFLSEKLRI